MMADVLPDHPIVEWCERTGYPSFAQPEYFVCECCSDELAPEDCYEDEYHDVLCEYCLKKHHKKFESGVL